jgi:hypothetical protein
MDEFVFDVSRFDELKDDVNLALTLELQIDENLKGINQLLFNNTINVLDQEDLKLTSCLEYSYDKLMKEINTTSSNKLIQCLLRDITNKTKDRTVKLSNDILPLLRKDIAKFFTIKRNDDQGQTSTTYLLYLKNEENKMLTRQQSFALLKCSNDDDLNLNILHEIAVGYALNTLNSRFSYMYGGFFCNAKQQSKISDMTCGDISTSIAYSMQQYINKTKTLHETLLDIYDPQEALDCIRSVLLQVSDALYKAQKAFKFVHYDLHSSNILVERLPKNISISLESDKYSMNIVTDVKAYIIDFGFSVMTYNSKYIAPISKESESFHSVVTEGLYKLNNPLSKTFPLHLYITALEDKSYLPAYDIYRLLIMSFNTLDQKFGGAFFKHLKEFLEPYKKQANHLKKQNWIDLFDISSSKKFFQTVKQQQVSFNMCSLYDYEMFSGFDAGDWLKETFVHELNKKTLNRK